MVKNYCGLIISSFQAQKVLWGKVGTPKLRSLSMPLFRGGEDGNGWTFWGGESAKVAEHVAADLQLLRRRRDRDKRSGCFEGIDGPFDWKSRTNLDFSSFAFPCSLKLIEDFYPKCKIPTYTKEGNLEP